MPWCRAATCFVTRQESRRATRETAKGGSVGGSGQELLPQQPGWGRLSAGLAPADAQADTSAATSDASGAHRSPQAPIQEDSARFRGC